MTCIQSASAPETASASAPEESGMSRDDIIGVIFVGLCTVIGAVLVYSIVTGQRLRFTGPDWVGTALAVIFFAAIIYSLVTPFRRRCPNPMTGQGRRWPWSRSDDDRPPPAA